MQCVVCRKDTENEVCYKQKDVVVVPICKECKKKTPDEFLFLIAMVRQMRNDGKMIGYKWVCGCEKNPLNELFPNGKYTTLKPPMQFKTICKVCNKQATIIEFQVG